MVFLKLLFAFLAIWFGLVVAIDECKENRLYLRLTAAISGSVCGLLWSFGIFN